MANYHFAWLGSKRAKKNNVHEKGWRLDIAARRGLPVPNGGILLDDFYWLCLQEKVIIEASNMVVIPKAEAFSEMLYTAVRFPRLDKPCAVRPLFASSTKAHLNMNVNDPSALAKSFADLWTAVLPAGENTRRDILIQEMVELVVAGTAVNQPEAETDIVIIENETQPLPKLGRWGWTNTNLSIHAQRLQKLLGGVRRTFEDEIWQISWADDGRVCWLLQVESGQT